MLNSIIDSLETKIYAVYNDLTYKEIISIEKGFATRPKPFFIVLKENKGKTISLFNDDFFSHSRYTFYNSNLEPTTINVEDWVLLKAYEPKNRSREVFYSISDPLGEIREISNLELNKNDWTEYFQINGICNIIKLVREISKFPDWSYYDLMRENEELKLTTNELLDKIKMLKEKIKELEKER